jgi:hypothetical protein
MSIMNLKYFFLCMAVSILLVQQGCKSPSPRITLESLLQEMTDRERLAKFPEPSYTCRQFSSYNTTSVAPGHYTWFANLDNNYFLRTETNRGRREFVLFDAEGPGCVVRFWATFARYDREGILRFYFDQEESPRIEGEAMEILSGGGLVDAPLSFSVSEDCDYSRRGHNLYLPIPYGSHLKITYESDGIPEARDGVDESVAPGQEMFYYQINYRTYEPGSEVKTFKGEDLDAYSLLIEETQEKLKNRDRGLDQLPLRSTSFSGLLSPVGVKKISLGGSRAIRKIQLKLEAENLPQALRSTVIQVAFDGEQTIWAPVGDFFGAGYKRTPGVTWYQEVSPEGTMKVFWIMPFKSACSISLINYGNQNVEILEGEISTSKWKWDDRSMHFGSSWYQNTRINTGLLKDRDGQGEFYDMPYTALKGKGVLVGDGVVLFNCSPAWWGEGDEKIFVDREEFPSHFGTGTEDYYGYAWCRPETFVHPFIAQPDGSGNLGIGYTTNWRYRSLDAIPFTEHLQFNMEMWHWGYTTMNHAPITYWYLKPGGECEISEDLAGIKEEVVERREQIFPPVINDLGFVEGEDLIISALSANSTARITPLPIPDKPRWTRSAQMWRDGMPGDSIVLDFICHKPGSYQITSAFVARGDKIKLSFILNGAEVLRKSISGEEIPFDQLLDFKPVELVQGRNQLKLKILDAPEAKSNALGIDYLEFRKL